MKKKYMKPSVQIIELKSRQVMMAGSPTAPLGMKNPKEEDYDYEFN